MALVYLPLHFNGFRFASLRPDLPRLKLPVASRAQYNACPHHLAYVSLDGRQRWALEGIGVVSEDVLADELKRMSGLKERSGYRASLAVRIPADQPARHFLRLHKIANEAGIEDFAFATVSPPYQ